MTAKEKPILFNGEMVRAILDGRKVQTRRPVKPQPWAWAEAISYNEYQEQWEAHGYEGGMRTGTVNATAQKSPFGQPGDRLWVRETWADDPGKDHLRPLDLPHSECIEDAAEEQVFYRATLERWQNPGKWRPSIHMPRWASRITLEVKRVWVERLQDISEEDARAEGVEPWTNAGFGEIKDETWKVPFAKLWDNIYRWKGDKDSGDGLGWPDNPWAWACEFEVIK